MKRYFIVAFLIFSSCFLLAQGEPVVTITPEKPLRGESVTITYNPTAKDAKIKDAKEMEIVYDNYAECYGKIKKMTLNNGKWSVSLQLSDTITAFLSFYVRDGGEFDDNNEKKFTLLIYKTKDIPIKNAYYYKAKYLQEIYGFGQIPYKKRDSMICDELRKELQYWPENSRAKQQLNSYSLANKGRIIYNIDSLKRAQDSLIKVLEKDPIKNAESLKKMKESNERSDRYRREQDLYKKIFKEADEEVKKELSEQFIKEFPNSFILGEIYRGLFYIYSNKKDTNKIFEMGQKWIETEKYTFSSAYNAVAWNLAVNKVHLDKALEYSNKAIENMKNDILNSAGKQTDSGSVIVAMPQNEKSKISRRPGLLSSYLDTKGWVYYQMGLYDDAENLIRKSFYLQPENKEISSHLVKIYEKTGKVDSLYLIYEKNLEKYFTDEKYQENFKNIYIQKYKSEEGLGSVLENLKVRYTLYRKDQALSRKINKEAPKFTIKMDNGEIFDLEKERGKAVVLYFFEATGISFKVQATIFIKIYDKYRDRKDFLILAINTSQGKLNTKEKHERLIKESIINFPSAYDIDRKVTKGFSRFFYTSVLETPQYSRIDTSGDLHNPAVFLIDKSGKVQFLTFPKSSNESIVEDLIFKLEYLFDKKD